MASSARECDVRVHVLGVTMDCLLFVEYNEL